MSAEEEWKPIFGWEDRYMISSHGRLKCLENTYEIGINGYYHRPEMIKKVFLRGKYYVAILTRNKKQISKSIHSLVLENFVGPRPYGLEGCHNDGNRTNNYLSNLRWDTVQGNADDRKKHGTVLRGSQCSWAVIDEELALWIKESKQKNSELMRILGLNESIIRRVRIGETWRHV